MPYMRSDTIERSVGMQDIPSTSTYPEIVEGARRRLPQITQQLWSGQPLSSITDPFDFSTD